MLRPLSRPHELLRYRPRGYCNDSASFAMNYVFVSDWEEVLWKLRTFTRGV